MIHSLSAVDLAQQIRQRELGVEEVMRAYIERIERVNPALNALVSLRPDAALAQARAQDQAFESNKVADMPLYGLPMAIKDLVPTKGLRTTMGSPIYADNVPDFDELFVQRLKAAGVIIVGKTNTPEFGAGSQTFNPVFGATRNPYAPALTCGGSSGGAAAALAAQMLPLADGSDLGGSLRNPAAFCNVVGLRPSPGRVPSWPKQFSSDPLAVAGPMGRTVGDLALLLSVMAGPDARVPISLQEPGSSFRAPAPRDLSGLRVAWSPTLGDFPVAPEITSVLEEALPTFTELGANVSSATPDLSDAQEIFSTFRAWSFVTRLHADYLEHGDKMKDTVRWNIEQGLQLEVADLSRASVLQSALIARVADFFQDYDFLLCPTTQVAPFPIEQEWVSEINGEKLSSYLDWMGVCWAITVTGCPAISVPAGFTEDGLPVGLQIVAPRWQDFSLLEVAAAFEQSTQHHLRRPRDGA